MFLLISFNCLAGIEQAPKSFKHQDKKAVFVDFTHAQYNLVYDTKKAIAWAETTIQFTMSEDGYPLFDSVSTPNELKINGEASSQLLIRTPGDASWIRLINKKLSPGNHTLTLKTLILNGTIFQRTKKDWERVSSGFFIRDLTDRMFLEKYLPSNYEYDQYKMDFDIKVTGTKRWHTLFANGKVTKVTENHYKLSLPDWYTASSVYFHLVPINKFVRWRLNYPSINGRNIPIIIYSNYRFYNYYVKRKAWHVLKELEADYGPFPHDQLIIYGTGLKGGMEHAGAVETSIASLGHELQHQYFAKCIHPANGNSGWLDEAIASWRDKGHYSVDYPFYKSVNLAAHSSYTRKTDKRSYKYGRSFMAYINKQLIDMGKPGLKDFLKIYFEKRKFTTVTTEIFKSDLQEYAQMSFGEDFNQYIYGGVEFDETSSFKQSAEHTTDDTEDENPHHPNITTEELNSII